MIIILGIAVLFLGDWIVKRYMDENLDENQEYNLVRNHVKLHKFYNQGAAMGMLRDKPDILNVVTIAVIAFFMVTLFPVLKRGMRLEKTGYMLVLGGALNNGYERLFKKKVTDYISFPKLPGRLKHIVFNLSDFFIMIGGLLLIVVEYRKDR